VAVAAEDLGIRYRLHAAHPAARLTRCAESSNVLVAGHAAGIASRLSTLPSTPAIHIELDRLGALIRHRLAGEAKPGAP